jgi:poly(3-hydroxybutyrate) depolymerase
VLASRCVQFRSPHFGRSLLIRDGFGKRRSEEETTSKVSSVSKGWLLFHLVALCLTLPLGTPASPVPKNSGIQKEFITFEGHKRTSYLFIPDSSPADVAAPLIVLLHGSGEDGLSLAEPWRSLASKEGIILVAPNSANSRVWDPHADHPNFIREVVDAVEGKHAVDPHRVYVFGHSAGGIYALTLSLLESQYFAAVAVHAGVLRRETDETFERAERKVPIALWSGTLDSRIPLIAVQGTQSILEAHGYQVELHEMTGRDHNYYVHANEVNQAVWTFLRRHKLEDQPKFKVYKP